MTTEVKQLLYQHCTNFVARRTNELTKEINLLQESAGSETKSSMGDKYETGREMITQEINRLSQQLQQLGGMQKVLDQLDLTSAPKVQLGSLVHTSGGIYFLGIPAGKIDLEGRSYFIVSPGSPVGKLLWDKVVGDKVTLGNRQLEVLGVV